VAPIHNFLKNNPSVASAVEPDELAMLQDLFKDVCSSRGIIPGTETATELAAEVIDRFLSGVKDPQTLRALLTS